MRPRCPCAVNILYDEADNPTRLCKVAEELRADISPLDPFIRNNFNLIVLDLPKGLGELDNYRTVEARVCNEVDVLLQAVEFF